MFHCLVHYPDIEKQKIHEFQNKYDPFVNLIDIHITFLFPIPEEIDKDTLERHIRKILSNWEPFLVHIKGIKKTWDHFMYLAFKKGGNKIIRLHDELYSGILHPYLRTDLPYDPHIGLGWFGVEKYDFNNPVYQHELDEVKFNKAKKEAQLIDTGYDCVIDKLTLVGVEEDFTRTWNIEDYIL